MQEFGSVWTEAKLEAVESYLGFYTTVLKKRGFKLCYVDAFAGSGSIKIKSGDEIEGSAIRALKYPFDKFYFFEEDILLIEALKRKIGTMPAKKKVEFHNADCNILLTEIARRDWEKENWRGVIFIDPFAMDLDWASLVRISNTEVFDVWYLFPFMALNRNLKRDGKISPANLASINRALGTPTNEWKSALYLPNPQLSLPFGESPPKKVSIEDIRKYILARLEATFPTVSPKAAFLYNEKKSPQFLLCFAGSNPSLAARDLSLKGADHILKHI